MVKRYKPSPEARARANTKRRVKNDETRLTATNYQLPWDSDEIEMLKQLAGRYSVEEIAVRIGRTRDATEHKAVELGISLDTHGKGHNSTVDISDIPIKSPVKTEDTPNKVHKVIYTPIMRHGRMVGQKRREVTYFQS